MPEPTARQSVVMGPYGETAIVHDIGERKLTRCGASWLSRPKYIRWNLLNHDAVRLCKKCWSLRDERMFNGTWVCPLRRCDHSTWTRHDTTWCSCPCHKAAADA